MFIPPVERSHVEWRGKEEMQAGLLLEYQRSSQSQNFHAVPWHHKALLTDRAKSNSVANRCSSCWFSNLSQPKAPRGRRSLYVQSEGDDIKRQSVQVFILAVFSVCVGIAQCGSPLCNCTLRIVSAFVPLSFPGFVSRHASIGQ